LPLLKFQPSYDIY